VLVALAVFLNSTVSPMMKIPAIHSVAAVLVLLSLAGLGTTDAAAQAVALPTPEAVEAAGQGAPSEGRMLNGRPDLSGQWEIIDPLRRPIAPPKLTPEAAAHAQADAARTTARLAAGYSVGIGAYLCQLNVGTPWTGQSEPLTILQTPEETLIIIERLSPAWHIYTDGRSLPDVSRMPPSYNGYSIGRWEGDTFVVETIGIRTLDTNPRPGVRGGGYTTPNTKLTLRMNLINEGRQLYMTATYDDPAVFEEPQVIEYTFFRNDPDTYALGYYCDPTDPTATAVVEPPSQ